MLKNGLIPRLSMMWRLRLRRWRGPVLKPYNRHNDLPQRLLALIRNSLAGFAQKPTSGLLSSICRLGEDVKPATHNFLKLGHLAFGALIFG